jgi:NADH:ubiquinone oxidoreductase subunit F (NADH-binding)
VKRGVVAEGAKTLDLLRMPLDPDLFRPFPDFMLGAAIVVYAEPANMFEHALNCVEFFRNESCGKCVPCRIGSEKMAEMLRNVLDRRGEFDQQLIGDLGGAMYDTSICGLGQVVPNSTRSVVKYFPEDLQAILQRTTDH